MLDSRFLLDIYFKYMYCSVSVSIYNSQNMEATSLFLSGWMDKEDMVIHTMERCLYSYKLTLFCCPMSLWSQRKMWSERASLWTSWPSLVAQPVKNLPAMWETWVRSLGWEDPWRRERLPTPVFWPGELRGLYSPWGRRESDFLGLQGKWTLPTVGAIN